ncbi:MAG: Lsr2 family protein [Bifidobacteriaceae bacterium]|jgi:hypothetical protein|nr:Lsr2 family protein [Bifidobacteriaceae bacterium]
MAQRVQVLLVDDLDGSEATETVTFGLDGATYEIDLSEAHAAELREGLAKWTESARRLSPRGSRSNRSAPRPPGRPRRAAASDDIAKIRAWARAQKLEVSDRGRIPAPIRDAYYAANKES